MIRTAKPYDLPAISKLLSAAELPTEGVSENLDSFLVVEEGCSVAAAGGIERYGTFALLRSLVVDLERRGRGLASVICDNLEPAASSQGIEQIYLLTETAERFFSKRGYVVVDRTSAPVEIANSAEFSFMCPDSAVLMCRVAQHRAAPDRYSAGAP
jgi:amino-acid N-acetyltransferase